MARKKNSTIIEASKLANQILQPANQSKYTDLAKTLASYIITLLKVVQIQEEEIEQLSLEADLTSPK